jgi:hypothetical protein
MRSIFGERQRNLHPFFADPEKFHFVSAVHMTRLQKSRLQPLILFGMVAFYTRLPFVVAEDRVILDSAA